MSASDGSFDSTVENVAATVITGGLTSGRHILFVRGKDASDNWGAFSAAFLDINPTSLSQTLFLPLIVMEGVVKQATRWYHVSW
jgi:hypothetical protein